MLDLDFFTKLSKFVDEFPCSATRWFSTKTHNVAIGGAKTSAHLTGIAIDLVFDSDLELIHAASQAHRFGFTGIELDLTNKHLHLDTKPRAWRVVKLSHDKEIPLQDWLKEHYPSWTHIPTDMTLSET